MSLLRKAFVPAIPFSEYREDNNFASALESIALELDLGLNSLSDLVALESIAHTTGKSMTVAESKMLAFSMEGVRADLGATGKPIVIGQTQESRQIALESLKEWGERAWEAIKKMVAKLIETLDEFATKVQYGAKAMKSKIDALVTHIQNKAGIITLVEFERGEYVTLDEKGDTVTIEQVSKNFIENIKRLRKYETAISSAGIDVWLSDTHAGINDHKQETYKVMGSVESKIIIPHLPAVVLGGWGVEAPDEVVETPRKHVSVKFHDLAKDISPTSSTGQNILGSQDLLVDTVRNVKEMMKKLQERLENSHQKLRGKSDNFADTQRLQAQLSEFRMCIRHTQNVSRLCNAHQQALNYFYNTVSRASLAKVDVVEN